MNKLSITIACHCKKVIVALALLLGCAQGAWATEYSYYIVEHDPSTKTLYFRGTNTEPSSANHQYSIPATSGSIPTWAQDLDTWKSVTTIVFEPSFAGAEPTSTAYWFARKPNLTSITGLQYLNTSKVTTMAMMFYDCKILTEVDLSGFNTENVKSMHQMFYNCSKLKTIVVGSGWTTSKVSYAFTVTDEMFKGCSDLAGQDGTNYDTSNVSKDYAHYGAGGYLTSEGYYWRNSTASSFSDVSGTTITIWNIGELKLLAQNVNGGNNYSGITIYLGRDLAFYPDMTNNFTAIGSSDSKCFAGTFDGQGHAISGLNIDAVGRQGLFGTIKGATIKNLTLDASTITSTSNSYAGGIVGYITGIDKVTNCHATNSVSVSAGNSAGGIVGSIYSGTVSITGCTSAATVVQTEGKDTNAGGIVGFCGYEGSSSSLSATIADCLYYGTSVSGGKGARTGAIVGSYVTSRITSTTSAVNLANNFYTYPDASVKGIGYCKATDGAITTITTDFDLATGHGAICTRVVTIDEDISDMGTQSGNAYSNGISIYANGAKYNGAYYSHVLALPDGEDNTSLIEQFDGQTFDVILRGRTLYKDVCWNTLCLPFSISNLSGSILAAATGCEIREMDLRKYQIQPEAGEPYGDYRTGIQDGKLYLFFKTTTSIAAGKPYIVKWGIVDGYNANDPQSYDYVSPTFRDVTIVNSAATDNCVESNDKKVTFQSTYAPFTRDVLDNTVLFLGSNDRLFYPDGTALSTVGPFRAYFQLNGVQIAEGGTSGGGDDDDYIPEGGGDARAFVLDISDEADAISDTLYEKAGKTDGRWFTIDGRMLQGRPAARGIYLHDGNKILIK